jgi:hypothetical protein
MERSPACDPPGTGLSDGSDAAAASGFSPQPPEAWNSGPGPADPEPFHFEPRNP